MDPTKVRVGLSILQKMNSEIEENKVLQKANAAAIVALTVAVTKYKKPAKEKAPAKPKKK
jgi:hypothetical protein